MYQFFVEENQLEGDRITILGSDVNHIKNVLRMKGGERVRISVRQKGLLDKIDTGSDENIDIVSSRSFFGNIENISDEEVTVLIESEDENGTELSNRIYLFQGLPKGDKMELIIQKAVELGIYEIIPVAMKNCVVKLDDKKAANKVKRWQAISESAAKQSKRTLIPEIQMPLTWKEALKKAGELDVVLVPFENERGMDATREILNGIKQGQSIGIFIGPEGGFAPEEMEMISPWRNNNEKISDATIVNGVQNKSHRISLGRRILRTETAGLATLSMLIFCLDE